MTRAGAMERWKFLGASAEGRGAETASIVINTPALDHMSDRVLPDGVDRSVFDRNPVVLWLHDAYGNTDAAGIPIGKATRVSVTSDRIDATWRWLTGDPFVSRVKNAWDQGVINAASVGFIPTEFRPNKDGGYDIIHWTLLEFSLVPIPANPDAVRLLRGLGLSGRPRADALRSPEPLLLSPDGIIRSVRAGAAKALRGPDPLLLSPDEIGRIVRKRAAALLRPFERGAGAVAESASERDLAWTRRLRR